MRRRLERSGRAESDLVNILKYGTTRFGERVGAEYFFSFDLAFERIRANPLIGTSVDVIAPGTRRLVHRRHSIFYRFDDERVRVLRVLHHAQDVTRFASS